MKVGDFVECWWWGPGGLEVERDTLYRGIVVDERIQENDVRLVQVKHEYGAMWMYDSDVRVINESR
jgi:hypothetical protein